MMRKFLKSLQFHFSLAIAIAISLIHLSNFPLKTLAQVDSSSSNPNLERIIFIPPQNSNEPSGSGRGSPSPGNTVGGTTRPSNTSCRSTNKPLTALAHAIPNSSNSDQQIVNNLTVDEYPTYWFYVPYTAPLKGKLSLTNAKYEELSTTTIPLPEKDGIISIRPNQSKEFSLEIDQKYRWVFSIICDPNSPSADISVEGWIRRVTLSSNLKNPIEGLLPREQARLYAKQGIWFNALTILGELLFSNPNDSNSLADWTDFLKSANQENLINEPIVKQYIPGSGNE